MSVESLADVRDRLLRRYGALQLSEANEAETRKKLVDELIENVLGWSVDDIAYEERVSEDGATTFADYILRTVTNALLIEAKRVGTTFTTTTGKRREKLAGRFLDGETGAAVRQARDYCRKMSIPFAAVTNGSQWIVFPAVRTDQVPFEESSAIVFSSLDEVLGADFDTFVSLLSREGLIDGNINIELIGRNRDQFDERRLNRFFTSSSQHPSNPVYPLIEAEINVAFADVLADSNPDLIEKCYVRTADRTKFDGRIRMHLAKREPLFGSRPPNPMRSQEEGALDQALQGAAIASRPLAMLILGPVGAGKTTFVHYTRKVSSREFFEPRKDKAYPHWIYVDFRSFKTGDSAARLIFDSLFEYFQTDPYFSEFERGIRSAYKQEIASLRSGPLALIARRDEAEFERRISDIIQSDFQQKDPYVKKLIAAAAKAAPIFIVVDNVDQIEDPSLQLQIFSDAIATASELRLSLVMSMREATYVKYRASATFDAFDFDPIQLEPPQVAPVLSRRFFLASELLKGKSGKFTALNGAAFDVADLSIFIDIVKSSVLGTYVGEYIDILANRDIRLALRMTRQFLERGYTDPARAIQAHNQSGKYTLPRHEAFRALLLGNNAVYSEEDSVIANPFDSRLARTSAQLLRFFILAALVRYSSEPAFHYVDGTSLRKHLRTLGFSDAHVLQALTDLCAFRLVHTASHGDPDFTSNYYPSRFGGYVVRELVKTFTFVENVMMDTFIADADVWNTLFEQSKIIRETKNPYARLQVRVNRTRMFFDHMSRMYHSLVVEAQRRGLPPEWCTTPIDDAIEPLAADCRRALQSAANLYGQGH